MKNVLLILIIFFCVACNRQPKDFSTVKIGMTKEEVRNIAGEPARKNDIGIQWWVYPEADRTVVFREDTVYSIITSAEARLDSINHSLQKADEAIAKDFKKIGNTIDSTAKNVKKSIGTLKKK